MTNVMFAGNLENVPGTEAPGNRAATVLFGQQSRKHNKPSSTIRERENNHCEFLQLWNSNI